MFEFLFKYPQTVFRHGTPVLLGRWPVWVLLALLAAIAGVLAWRLWRQRQTGRLRVGNARAAVIWALQSSAVTLLLLMLWQPAISVASLKPQQNVIVAVIDDSASMGLTDSAGARQETVQRVLASRAWQELSSKFQVRLYRLGEGVTRLAKTGELAGQQKVTRLSGGLQTIAEETSGLPVGAVVLVSDGNDSTGGIENEALNALRRRRVPVHAIGIGAEKPRQDIEVIDAQVPTRTLANARVNIVATFAQFGFAGKRANLVVKEGDKIAGAREITLKADGLPQTEALGITAGPAGVRTLQVQVSPLQGEENTRNNAVPRLLNVVDRKPRILYIEGEPRWEFKFIRRAIEEDQSLELTTMLRTTANKMYRQGIRDPKELEAGFPTTVDELFAYEAIVIGGMELGAFSTSQQELLKAFVDRRGGGLLWLGGRAGLSDGGWQKGTLADVLPLKLPESRGTFHREPAAVGLTEAGRDNLLCRLVDDPAANVERWRKLPLLADWQEAGTPKPGAQVLVEMTTANRTLPLLTVQNYGRGRSAVMATSGTWRWQMNQELADRTHEMFWQQLLRWLSSETPGRVTVTMARPVLADETKVTLRAEVRDKNYLPAGDASVQAKVLMPGGGSQTVDLQPDQQQPGVYTANWEAPAGGTYVAEVEAKQGTAALGAEAITFLRQDGVAEYFHTQQNVEALQRLAQATGGRYYKADDLGRLANEVSYSEAGLTTRETMDLWDMPVLFAMLFGLRGAEWLLRRRWGVV